MNIKAQKIVSLVVLAIGIVLMAYMVTVEGEPGALPLLLVVVGIGWFLFTQFKRRAEVK